ncbi:hypothetical protein JHK85_019082 [Glycine max]|nr:hypothetical protein JHK85_019082 [Glycine max]
MSPFVNEPTILKQRSSVFIQRTSLSALSESGKLLFTEQHKLMMYLILTIVLYFFCATIGTIFLIYKGSLLRLIIWVMLIVGAVVSVLALNFVSTIVSWITLAMWLGIFAVVAYDYGVPQKIKNWIKDP